MNSNKAPEHEHALKYHTLTYGCQMNFRDTETMEGLLEAAGFEAAAHPDEADVIIINTCSVRHSAENKVYGKLGELKKLKASKPELIIAVAGCMSQLEENRARLAKAGVDLIFGTHNIHQLPELVAEALEERHPLIRVWSENGPVVEGMPHRFTGGISAFVNVMYGCNNFCSYCIVPYTRGRERSREPESILSEVRELVDQGVKEVTLLGQNVNSYGQGLDRPLDFAELLSLVNQVEGLERVRFTTSHPKDMSERLIEAVAGLDKVCEHIHAPLQAGSNRILRAMNRHYTREEYGALAQRIRERIPGVALTSDLIVGFPGETEEDFEETLDMVRQVRFDAAFTFIFSPRSGTRAATLPGQLSWEEKRARLLELNRVQYQIALEINQQLEGSVEEVLIEGPSKTDQNKLTGRTRTNRVINFVGPDSWYGRMVNVKIIKGKTFSLLGETVS